MKGSLGNADSRMPRGGAPAGGRPMAASTPGSAADNGLRLLRLRDQIVESLQMHDSSRLRLAVKAIASMSLSAEDLASTGIGILFNDGAVKAQMDSTTRALAEARVLRWRTDFCSLDGGPPARVHHPLGGQRGEAFLATVDRLESWLRSVDSVPSDHASTLYRAVAVTLALHRAHDWHLLDGCVPEEVSLWGRLPEEAALLGRACAEANRRGRLKRKQMISAWSPEITFPREAAASCSPQAIPPVVAGVQNADVIAARVLPAQVKAAEEEWSGIAQRAGVPSFGQAGPRASIRAIAAAA